MRTKQPTPHRILALMADDEMRTCVEIAEAFGMRRDTISLYVGAAAATGYLERVCFENRRPVYKITESGRLAERVIRSERFAGSDGYAPQTRVRIPAEPRQWWQV